MALEMGMNLQEFATQYSEGNAVLEESWRRIYLMLFITDQHFAIIRNMPIFGLRDAITTVELPCGDYQSGNISQPTTFQQYDARELADVEVIYSSSTYLIDAVRIVIFILRNVTEIGGFSEGLVLVAEPKVAAWGFAAANLQKGSARNGWEGRRTLISGPPNCMHCRHNPLSTSLFPYI